MSASPATGAGHAPGAGHAAGATGAPHAGSIELIVGPVASEKTTTMLARLRRRRFAMEPVLLVKSVLDTRYGSGDVVSTHGDSTGPTIRQESVAGTSQCAAIRVVQAGRLSEVAPAPEEMTIGVDEGQFYSDLPEMCERWANEGRRVVIAALDGDFKRRLFGRVNELLPLCEEITKLRGVCGVCHQTSSFSQRLVPSTTQVVIGGSESYRSVCRSCYFA